MKSERKKYRLFYRLEEELEIPMFLLALFWLYLFLVEMFGSLSSTQENLIYVIWFLFIFEFLLKLSTAPRKWQYLKENWLTIISLIIPALRAFRLFYALRLLRSARVITTTRIIRALTSGKRFMSALKEAQGPQPTPEMNVGILVASGNVIGDEKLKKFSRDIVNGVEARLEEATGMPWFFDQNVAYQLDNSKTKSPSDFLDPATLKMAEGPYDLIIVVTDVGLMSRKHNLVYGLCSGVSRVVVISTRKLISTERKKDPLSLEDEIVIDNGAALLMHLLGHVMGLEHGSASETKVMSTFRFKEKIRQLPQFSKQEQVKLKEDSKNIPDRELINGNWLETFIFHLLMTLRHPKRFFTPILTNKAIFLPLSLPGLATAAVAPAIILIFTAEIWDVGLGMSNSTAIFFAVVSIMLASFYLVRVQSLFLPRKEKRVLTEHLAVANSVIYVSIFLACIGLFLLVGGLMMIIEIYVFPSDLMQTWPTLNKPEITLIDKIRLAVFISTVGVTTGALAGGLESKTLIRHLALFRGSE